MKSSAIGVRSGLTAFVGELARQFAADNVTIDNLLPAASILIDRASGCRRPDRPLDASVIPMSSAEHPARWRELSGLV